MKILQALERKRAYEELLEEALSFVGSNISNSTDLSSSLEKIDKYIEEIFYLDRKITNKYYETVVAQTKDSSENITDALSYIDCLDKKIAVMKYFLLCLNKEEIQNNKTSVLDVNAILSTVSQYEDLKNTLSRKIRSICLETDVD
jgi:hypothetical protein